MKSKFRHYDLKLVEPAFSSNLTSVIVELEKLRTRILGGSTPADIFFQLKTIFHWFESLGSARIEGNNTTLADLIEKKIEKSKTKDEQLMEIENIEKAMSFIETNIDKKTLIDRAFISEIHKIVVRGLNEEGDKSPGEYRNHEVSIKGSIHKPPSHVKVDDYMKELIGFINKNNKNQHELLVTAITHHRFAWIHPFGNGNGRLVRMLTYAMLIKQGFNVGSGRILNPTAVFCINRNKYYNELSIADKGTGAGILRWNEYVLSGLLREINKIDNLSNKNFVKRKILKPAINTSYENDLISQEELNILRLIFAQDDMVVTQKDLAIVLKQKTPTERSRAIKKLKDRKIIKTIYRHSRKYTINFIEGNLLRGVSESLKNEKFIQN